MKTRHARNRVVPAPFSARLSPPAPSVFPLDAETRRHAALFVAGLVAYLATRLYHITLYPTYFFCDEANQAVHAYSLMHNGFEKYGVHFPTFFDQFGRF